MDPWPPELRPGADELRVEPGPGLTPRITGYAIVFNRPSEILRDADGGVLFREVMRPSAVERTLREELDVRALANHDTNHVLGRTRATPPTLRLRADAVGLLMEIDPPPRSQRAAELVESIQRGDVTGASFRFKTRDDFTADSWVSWTRGADGVPVRAIHDMVIREVSIVAFPAYPDTTVSVRSLEGFERTEVYRPSLALLQQRHRQAMLGLDRPRR